MEIINGKVIIKHEVKSIAPSGEFISYTDKNGTQIVIESKLIIHLYDMLKFDYNKHGAREDGNWEKYCENLFKDKT